MSGIMQVLAGVQCTWHGRWNVSLSRSDPDRKPRVVLCDERRCLWRLSNARNAGISSSHGHSTTFHYSRNWSV